MVDPKIRKLQKYASVLRRLDRDVMKIVKSLEGLDNKILGVLANTRLEVEDEFKSFKMDLSGNVISKIPGELAVVRELTTDYIHTLRTIRDLLYSVSWRFREAERRINEFIEKVKKEAEK